MEDKPLISHFALYSFTPDFWDLEGYEKQSQLTLFLDSVSAAGKAVYCYQVFPTRSEYDIMIWSADWVESNSSPATFFDQLAGAVNPFRRYVEPIENFWGMTRPSVYARGKSDQEIDPFKPERLQYHVIYPFSKTSEWYMLGRDTRQGMMNAHIRIGKTFGEIMQLLVYSFGVQDQEFVVSYEMDDLGKFSDLVNQLRATDARIYTLLDTPIITCIYKTKDELISLFSK